MQLRYEHAYHDSNSPCTRPPTPQTEGAGSPRRQVSLRLSAPRNPTRRRAAHAGRSEGALGPPLTRQSPRASCPDYSRGEGQPVIVVDASAMMEVLLNRPSGERLANRLFDPLEA